MVALDRTTVGVVLDKLAARGLVVRRRSKTDRRADLINCTAAGYALLDRAVPAVEAAQARILAPCRAPNKSASSVTSAASRRQKQPAKPGALRP